MEVGLPHAPSAGGGSLRIVVQIRERVPGNDGIPIVAYIDNNDLKVAVVPVT